MKTLDQYVMIRYVKMLISTVVAATVVFLILDLVENIDKFIDSGVANSVIIEYYYLYIPYVIYLILPVATLLATLFTIGGMTMKNELTAIHSSGIPFFRLLCILLSVTALSAAGAFGLGETLVPESNRKRLDIYRYEVKKLPRESRARQGKHYLQIGPNRQLYVDHYRSSTREAFDVELLELSYGKMIRKINAEKMVWLDDSWRMQDVTEITFRADGSVLYRYDFPHSVSGIGIKPDEFERMQTKPEEMTWRELKEFIHRLKHAGGMTLKWEVELLSKISLPAASIVIVLFGAPIAARKRRGGTALGFGVSLFICFVYFGFIQVGKVLGYNGDLAPWLSAWIGNIFFGLLGISVLSRFRG